MHDEIRASSDEIFSLRLQMKLNPPPLTLRSKISSRSDFIHDSGFIPTKADLVEKSTSFEVLFSGGGWWIRTTEVSDNRFTVCPLWPLGKSPILELVNGVEPSTA